MSDETKRNCIDAWGFDDSKIQALRTRSMQIAEVLDSLTEMERAIFDYKMGLHNRAISSVQEIAENLSISPQLVENTLDSVLRRIRQR